MLPDILSENMGDDIAKVYQYPLSGPCTLDAQRFGAGAREATGDMVRDGACLTVRIHRAYDQVVGNRGQGGYLEDKSLSGLFITHCSGNGEGRRPSCLCDRAPLGRDDVEVYKIPLRAATDLPRGVLGGFEHEYLMRKLCRVVAGDR